MVAVMDITTEGKMVMETGEIIIPHQGDVLGLTVSTDHHNVPATAIHTIIILIAIR